MQWRCRSTMAHLGSCNSKWEWSDLSSSTERVESASDKTEVGVPKDLLRMRPVRNVEGLK